MCDCSSFIDLNGHSCLYLIWCLFIDFCEIWVMGHLDNFIFYMNLEFYHHNRVKLDKFCLHLCLAKFAV